MFSEDDHRSGRLNVRQSALRNALRNLRLGLIHRRPVKRRRISRLIDPQMIVPTVRSCSPG
jgi:hypothetical protein